MASRQEEKEQRRKARPDAEQAHAVAYYRSEGGGYPEWDQRTRERVINLAHVLANSRAAQTQDTVLRQIYDLLTTR